MPDVKLLFGHTINALNKTIDDFKKASLAFRIATLLISAGYFIYAIVTETGILWANSLSLAILVAYNVFELVADKLEIAKTAKKTVKHAYKWLKIVIKSFTLVVMLYGIYVAADSVNGIRIILATLMIIMWVLQVLLEIVSIVAEHRIKYIIQEFQKDYEPINENYIQPTMEKINWLIDKKHKIDDVTDKIGGTIEHVKDVTTPKIVETTERIKYPFLMMSDKRKRKKELKELVRDEKEQRYLVASDIEEDKQ